MFPIRDHNPSGATPFVTYALIAANVVIFLSYYHLFSDDRALGAFWYDWALIPSRISSGEAIGGLITSMFLHGGIMHLLGNMLFLYIFGDNIEEELGHVRFAMFYLACGIVAGLLQYFAEPLSQVPTVGASGAIAGVMGAYLLMYPKARVDILIIFIVFFKVFTIPAWIMLAVWFAFQVNGGFGSSAADGGVAYWAHVGGFVAGLALMLPGWLRQGGPQYWGRTHGHPPHPEAKYPLSPSNIPRVRRRR
ncbi:rhomboid family intramembrane serine protease [Puniceibacterium sp. IMCC21224]|uniref:rhomboid family intramembrane serine protease n=1 Tax=Puniceibacterium sp. IMCC21224 TaxID=1618204 RepID=UPI00064E0128|nr:rhomboid family intramembrane serine protease [Puniceibacterium sp. IMCC21224]KMK68916.1 putative membrane protein [Puniceibacterium sp. IMCC21224]